MSCMLWPSKTTLVRLLMQLKAEPSIFWTEAGMVTAEMAVARNALCPISFRVEGSLMLRMAAFSKALA